MTETPVQYEIRSEMSGSAVVLATVQGWYAAKRYADLPTDANIVAVEIPNGARTLLNGRSN